MKTIIYINILALSMAIAPAATIELTTATEAKKAEVCAALGALHLNESNLIALPATRPCFSRSGPSFISFKRSDVADTARGDFGQLGAGECNMAWNMDYTTAAHKYWDSTKCATWAACVGKAAYSGFSVQYAQAGLSGGGGDIWTLAGSPYIFSSYANASGACVVIGGDTAGNDNFGPTMNQYARLVTVRGDASCDIAGKSDLVLEGRPPPGNWGFGTAIIKLNTVSNGAVTTGTGLFTAGGAATVASTLGVTGVLTASSDLNVVGAYKTNGAALFPLSVANGGRGTATMPIVIAHKSGSQQILTAGATGELVTYETEVTDTNTCFADNTFTPNVAGYYTISAGMLGQYAQDGKFFCFSVYKSNTEAARLNHSINGASGDVGGAGSCIVYANGSTDYFTIKASNNYVTNGPGVYPYAQYTYFHAAFLRP